MSRGFRHHRAGLLLALALLATPGWATEPGSRFTLELQAPDGVRELLWRHMDLQRFRTLEDLDATELDRLLLRAPEDLRRLLATQGHFSPSLRVVLAPAAQPTDPVLGTVRIEVAPGPVTRIASFQVYLRDATGETTPETLAWSERLRAELAPAPDTAFTQATWDRLKADTLRRLTRERHPLARLQNSLADIDTAHHAAHLHLELETGPAYVFGPLRLTGDERYPRQEVERQLRLAGWVRGHEYRLETLQEAQRRLSESGFYDAAFVTVEPLEGTNEMAVVVQVRETKRQQWVLGVGASTDHGARLSLEHTHHRVPGFGWRARSRLQTQGDDRTLSSEWQSPLDASGWHTLASIQGMRQVDGALLTTGQRLRLGRSKDTPTQDRNLFLQWDRARTVNRWVRSLTPIGADAALSINQIWTRRAFDSLVSPRQGHGLSVELGAGTTLGASRRPFVRTTARWLGLFPWGDGPGAQDRLALRLEGGAVFASNQAPLPDTQLFLTGGDTTVRGYNLRAIGVRHAAGGLTAGRYLAIASLEWQRPLNRQGPASEWEHVLFLDMGAVADRPGQLRPHWGLGTGLRYQSPVGPLQVDLAYGAQARQLKLHLRVGFAF